MGAATGGTEALGLKAPTGIQSDLRDTFKPRVPYPVGRSIRQASKRCLLPRPVRAIRQSDPSKVSASGYVRGWRAEFGYPPIIPWYPGTPYPPGVDVRVRAVPKPDASRRPESSAER